MYNCLNDLIHELHKEFALTEDDDLEGGFLSAGEWEY